MVSPFRGIRGYWAPFRDTIYFLGGGVAGAIVLSLLGVPAGALIGAVVGSALVNRTPLRADEGLPVAVRVAGLMMLGTVAGGQLDPAALSTLFALSISIIVMVVALIGLDLLLARVLVKRYGLDPVTAVLACAPGGLSEVAAISQVLGARTGIILAIHTVRILVVVLVVLPILVLTVGRI